MSGVKSATLRDALSRMTARPSRLALGWFVAVTIVITCAGLCCLLLVRLPGVPGPATLPALFFVSTLLLVAVSAGLFHAERSAQHEKQRRLCVALALSLLAAVLFLAVQGAALAALVRNHSPAEAPLGSTAWLLAAVALHALHVSVGTGWLVYVVLRGLAGHYDHEYRFGLTACGWCWHALGIIWLMILASLATTF